MRAATCVTYLQHGMDFVTPRLLFVEAAPARRWSSFSAVIVNRVCSALSAASSHLELTHDPISLRPSVVQCTKPLAAHNTHALSPAEDSWPTVHARPFAHSSPIWIKHIGSPQPNARAATAADLIRGIDVADMRARASYGKVAMSRMQARCDKARAVLREMIEAPAEEGAEAMQRP